LRLETIPWRLHSRQPSSKPKNRYMQSRIAYSTV
jgi:hypothetical protein